MPNNAKAERRPRIVRDPLGEPIRAALRDGVGGLDGAPDAIRAAVRMTLDMPVPMLVCWGPQHLMFYNGAYARLLGPRHPGALGQPLAQVWAEVIPNIGWVFDRALGGDAFEMPDRMLRVRRGRHMDKVWYTVTMSPVRDADEVPCGVVATVFDTSDAVRAERRGLAERGRARRLLDTVLESVPGNVYAKDLAGRMVIVNRGTAELFRRPVTDVIGRTGVELLADPADTALIRANDRIVETTGATLQVEEVLHDSKGRPLTFISTKAPLRDGAGRIIGIVGTSIDITERKAMEDRLRRSTAELETLLDNSPYGVAFFDRDKRFLRINRRLAEWNGHPAAAHIGRRYDEMVPASDFDIGDLIATVLETGQPLTVEFQGPAPADAAGQPTRFWLSTFYPVSGDDRVEAVGAWVIDISDTRRAEQALAASNEALSARVAQAVAAREAALEQLHEARKLETLGQLTGGVAHDFNNLLTPIMAGIDMLSRRLEDDARATRIAGNAMQAAERARVLVQRLLAFGRRQTLAPELVSLAALIDGMTDLIERSLGPGIAVTIDVPASLPPVRIDPNQLELALLNLAVNARDAMPDGGRLTIAARLEPAPADATGPAWVALSVADTGLGMDAATLARATEPFFTTKAMGQGTGLGLSMVHGLAAQSGGALHLDSRAGVGTTATIRLPPASGTAAAAVPAEPDALSYGDGVVLLVDDEALVRTATAESLRDAGWRVIEAASPSEALARLDGGVVPDVLVTDHMMPGMTGAQLAQMARRRLPGLRVVLITGYALPDSLDVTSLEVVTKPFRLADLAARLARPAAAAALFTGLPV